jgi:hypothetical protein
MLLFVARLARGSLLDLNEFGLTTVKRISRNCRPLIPSCLASRWSASRAASNMTFWAVAEPSSADLTVCLEIFSIT